MKRLLFLCLAAIAVSASPSFAGPDEGGKEKAKEKAKSKSADKLDIQKWPLYSGAELIRQVTLGGDQIASLAGGVPPEAKAKLAKLMDVVVLGYKLPGSTDLKKVIAFYEPRALAAGYKLLVKELGDPEDDEDEATAVFTGPEGGILVITASEEGKAKTKELEIVHVHGDLKGLAGLGALKDKLGTPPSPDKKEEE